VFKRVGIVSRLDREDAVKLSAKVAGFLRDKGLDTLLEDGLAKKLGKQGVPLNQMSGDFVVTIGGDGTVLRTVHGISRGIPLFTINMGMVAFFADVYPREASKALERVLRGEFIRDNCFMLTTNLDISDALNEVRIGSEFPQQMIEMGVSINGTQIARDKVDAVLTATSTGASAYALSAGVSVVDPRIEAIVVVPICPLSANFIPHLFPSYVEVSVKPENDTEFNVLVDGQVRKKLDGPLEVKVKKSKNYVTFLRTGENFYERLRRRLRMSSVAF